MTNLHGMGYLNPVRAPLRGPPLPVQQTLGGSGNSRDFYHPVAHTLAAPPPPARPPVGGEQTTFILATEPETKRIDRAERAVHDERILTTPERAPPRSGRSKMPAAVVRGDVPAPARSSTALATTAVA